MERKCKQKLDRKSYNYGLSNGGNIFDLRWPLKVKGQDKAVKTLMSNISKTVRDEEKVSIDVKKEVIYGLSNGGNIFDLWWPLKVKGQGQTLKTLKSNISKTVRDKEKVSIDVK